MQDANKSIGLEEYFMFEFNEQEKKFLKEFYEKQHSGAKDNVGTMTPIHVVERIRKEYVESEEGDAWLWTDDYEWKTFDNFDEMLNHARKATKKEYPPYEEVEYEEVDDIWIESEKTYCKAYGIKAYPCKMVQYTEPVAFFFILDEAKRYKNDYQSHNCRDCRIYTYSMGYSNYGDLPVFRELLLKMGKRLIEDEKSD
ncbi:MAG: hypothetical protein J6D26_07115 [Clostridia bacterium]|nr:hypothetical protein [Clostridia bacterium]